MATRIECSVVSDKAVGSEVRYDRIKWNQLVSGGRLVYTARFMKELITCRVEETYWDSTVKEYTASVEWHSKKEIVGKFCNLNEAKKACVDHFVKWIESYSETILSLKADFLKWDGVDSNVGFKLEKVVYSSSVSNGYLVLLVNASVVNKSDVPGGMVVSVIGSIQGCRKNYYLPEVTKTWNFDVSGKSNTDSFISFYVSVVNDVKQRVLNHLKKITISNKEWVKKMQFENENGVDDADDQVSDNQLNFVFDGSVSMNLPMSIKIKDKNGEHDVILDAEDAGKLGSFVWRVEKERNGKVVVRSLKKEGNRVYLHRLIMGLGEGDRRYVHHHNGNGMDNRKENLAIKPCDKEEKAKNLYDDTVEKAKIDTPKIDIVSVPNHLHGKDVGEWLDKFNDEKKKVFFPFPYKDRKKEAKVAVETKDVIKEGDGKKAIKILVDSETGEQMGVMIDGSFVGIDKLKGLV